MRGGGFPRSKQESSRKLRTHAATTASSEQSSRPTHTVCEPQNEPDADERDEPPLASLDNPPNHAPVGSRELSPPIPAFFKHNSPRRGRRGAHLSPSASYKNIVKGITNAMMITIAM